MFKYIDRDSEQGATMAEYGLLLVGVAAVAAGAVALFGGRLALLFNVPF